jgi:hypothetical protein
MYSFTHAEAFSSDGMWAVFSAAREIGAAISTLDSAGSALVSLIDDCDWQSDGVRALHELLGRLQDRTAAQLGDLKTRQWEIEAVGAA